MGGALPPVLVLLLVLLGSAGPGGTEFEKSVVPVLLLVSPPLGFFDCSDSLAV
jgi:hypothetical protein